MSTPATPLAIAAGDAPNPRKQKCDEQLPVCSNCRRAGASDCDKAAVASQPLPIAYTRALEDRVAQLEMMLAQGGGEGANKIARTDAAEVVEIISLGNFEAPAYVGPSAGPSAGLSLAVNLGEMVQATVWKKAIPEHGGVSPGFHHQHHHRGRHARLARLLHLYLAQPHARYPSLQPAELWMLHGTRYSEHSPAAAGLSLAQRYGIFKLYMVYAIGATLLQLTEKALEADLSPERFYMTALQHMAAAREPRTVQNIEAMMLLVIYHLRSASGLGLWCMIGLAMRTCIDLGMHRKSHEQGLRAEAVQARRRLFWTVYALERVIAMSLGRPLSLPDRHIDVRLPDVAVSVDAAAAETGTGGSNSLLLLFQLRRIEARIHHSIYRADKPLAALRPKLDPLYKLLEDWRRSVRGEGDSGDDDDDDDDNNNNNNKKSRPRRARSEYLLLHYHRAVHMLIQPFLVLLPVTDPYFERCLAAAGRICQVHKRLHQSRQYGHSFIAVQTIFVSGATLLYGLWTHTHRVWSVTRADDLRACSLVLFVMSERAAWVRKYRDAFELLVAATMQKLAGGGGGGGGGGAGERRRADDVQDTGDMADMAARAQQHSYSHGHHQEHLCSQARIPEPQNTTTATAPPVSDEEGDVWHLVRELANWIDQAPGQDAGGDADTAVWMPDFETLQAFPSCTPR
ncbi:hypothetical protein SCUCBS95973_006667 [Sporothrix curviconia]|uniref:Xylanolytic transcriptional activator regulatory domain-containing protein n=1 Tax=Sporothrix curviconia TaxID=1260050 RepID=A0ABP0C9I7_9PEZI